MWVDTHVFFADLDPDPAVFLNACPDPDPDPVALLMRIWIRLKKMCNKLPIKSFLELEKTKKMAQK